MIALLHFLPDVLPSFDNHIWGTAGQLFIQEKCKLLRSPFLCYRREFVGPRQTLLPVLLGQVHDQKEALAQTARLYYLCGVSSQICNSYDGMFAKHAAPAETRYKQYNALPSPQYYNTGTM
jgi:hypothetical protein